MRMIYFRELIDCMQIYVYENIVYKYLEYGLIWIIIKVILVKNYMVLNEVMIVFNINLLFKFCLMCNIKCFFW